MPYHALQATTQRREFDANRDSDRRRLVAFLHTLGGSEQLIAGWKVAISSDHPLDDGLTEGFFLSREGKRFRSFLGVAHHLGLRPVPRPPQSANSAMRESLLMSLPNCQVQGHRFGIPGSRRCSVCRRIVMVHTKSSSRVTPPQQAPLTLPPQPMPLLCTGAAPPPSLQPPVPVSRVPSGHLECPPAVTFAAPSTSKRPRLL